MSNEQLDRARNGSVVLRFEKSSGSGALFGSSRQLVGTAWHVVAAVPGSLADWGPIHISTRFSIALAAVLEKGLETFGPPHYAKLVWRDEDADAAILALDRPVLTGTPLEVSSEEFGSVAGFIVGHPHIPGLPFNAPREYYKTVPVFLANQDYLAPFYKDGSREAEVYRLSRSAFLIEPIRALFETYVRVESRLPDAMDVARMFKGKTGEPPPLGPGASGSPLIDCSGRLVTILTGAPPMSWVLMVSSPR
jgi:hypothetical protein